MYFYIKEYQTHTEYIEASKQLNLKELSEEEYRAAIVALEQEVNNEHS